MEEQPTIYQAKLHWAIFLPAVCLLGLSLYGLINSYYLYQASLLLSVVALLWLLLLIISYQCSALTVKKQQLTVQTGLLLRKTTDIPLSKIESIDVRQSIVGVLFGYGTLIITGTGGSKQSIQYLSKPLSCRRYIEQNAYKLEVEAS